MTTYEDVLKDYYVELERLGMYDDFPVPEAASYDEWIGSILIGESSRDQHARLDAVHDMQCMARL